MGDGTMGASILIVEDEIVLAKAIARSLRQLGYEVAGMVHDGEGALEMAAQCRPDLVLMDIKLQGEMDGITAADRMRSCFDIPVVYLTSYQQKDVLERAKVTEPYGYLGKPFSALEIRGTIETALYRHEMERRLKESEKRYRDLWELVPHGIAEVDLDGKITSVNSAYCRTYGGTPQELTGKSIVDLEASQAKKDELNAYLERLIREQPPPTPWFSSPVTNEGGNLELQVDWDYKRDDQGNVTGFVFVTTDITDRKRAEEKVVQALEESRKANRETRSLLGVSQVLLERRDFEESARAIYDAAKKAVGATAGYVALLSQDGTENEVLFLDSGGRACAVDPDLPMPVRGLRAVAYTTGAVAYENDFHSSRWMEYIPEGHATLDNVMFAPLLIEGKAVGVIGLANKPGGFSDDDARLTSAFADFTATGLRNARTEETIVRQNQFLHTVIESLTHPFYVVDAHDYTISIANSAARMNRVQQDDAPTCYALTHGRTEPCDTLLHPCPLQEVKETGKPFSVEHVHYDAAGKPRIMEVQAYPLFDERGSVKQMVEYCIDVTERKNAEKALRESEERFRQLAENTEDVFWLTEPGKPRRVVYLNPVHQKVWGIKREEVYSSPGVWLKSLHEEDRENVLQAYDDFLNGLGEYNVEYRIVRPDGSIRWIWDRAFPVRDDRGSLYRVAGLAQDITDRKRDEQRQAELLDEIKHFAYIVSHDLRAPLVSIRGFSDELEAAVSSIRSAAEAALDTLPAERRYEVKYALEEDLPESLGFIKSSVERMDQLITAILKLSRLGQVLLSPEPLDMNQLVDDILKSLAHQISRRDIKVSVQQLPETTADPTSMEQIFGNLLDNAIKYLDPDRPGEIVVTGWPHGDENVFQVKDNGMGIQKSDFERIFQVFQRSGKQDVTGEGMGLAYVRTLVRRHGGRIWCESEPGRGSVFSFTIPNRLPEK